MKRNKEESLKLELLAAIQSRSDVTQRHLANHLGVALGLANSYLRRCVRQGLVKVKHAPANRYLYYLTPKGLAEKGRLTAEYLTASMQYYHSAGQSMRAEFQRCEANGERRVLLAGMSELAEIASVRAHDFDISIIGTLDLGSQVERFLGRPVWLSLDGASKFDVVLFTALSEPWELYTYLRHELAPEQLIVPEVAEALLQDHPEYGRTP